MRLFVRILLGGVIGVSGSLFFVAGSLASPGIVPGSFHAEAINRDGTVDTLAGSHPYEYRASFVLNHDTEGNAEGNARDVIVDLPPGFVGNPTVVPRCERQDFDGETANCPPDTQIGTLTAVIREKGTVLGPAGAVYNLAPPKGYAASLGFYGLSFDVILNAKLIPGGAGGYRVSVVDNNVPKEGLEEAIATIWGVPADAGHNEQRECVNEHGTHSTPCTTELAPEPFLTLPTSCEPELPTTLAVDFAGAEGLFSEQSAESPTLVGCGALDFGPEITVVPEASAASTPTGLHVDLHMPQKAEESTEGRAEADLRDTTVTLPEGMVVNPSSANGLESCSSAQIGLGSISPQTCPKGSKIGTVEVDTPLVDHPLPGAVYLAAQNDNPFHSLLAIYVVVEDEETGTVVKLAGHVEPNPVTGQLVTTFSENPQVPFEDFKLDFTGGPRAPLITPETCGQKTVTTVMTPWTSPEHPSTTPSSTFSIGSGPGGGSCVDSAAQEPNAPVLRAGTTPPLAGFYSPFELNLIRADGSQQFAAIDTTLPPGLTGKLTGVARCSDQQIAAAMAPGRTGAQEIASPSCPAASKVGVVDAAAGAGPDPVHVTGQVYLAGPYEGAPFSLAIITPAVAGPFDLGVVVVRSALYINPTNAQVTVKSDPLPKILDGVPLDLKSISVKIDREQFTLNPTSCERMSLGATVTSTLGQTASLSNPFQVGGCAGLPFKPIFQVSTSGNTSKAAGASLTTSVSFPHEGPSFGQGGEANIAKVHVELPKQLPSRLTTLQKACTERQFGANPAGCPPESVVGHAVARTPILSVPLEGPAYFVSHGNAAFPELVMVLQGEGVTIQLNGETDIKKGITSSTFNQIPDAPVENFVLTLPEGPHSALSAPAGHLCEQNLIMPTKLTGQNGAQTTQNTHIEVEGCSNALAITSHKIKKRTVTVQVYVPAAGSVKVAGRGLSSKTTTAKNRETMTFSLSQKKAGRLKTKLMVTYTPKKGKRQSKSLTLRFEK